MTPLEPSVHWDFTKSTKTRSLKSKDQGSTKDEVNVIKEYIARRALPDNRTLPPAFETRVRAVTSSR